jgi:putative thymidine phosphorylase
MDTQNLALEAIRKKLVGKTLNYKEIFAIMDSISHEKLGDVLTTYFVASGYSQGFTSDEIFYLTRAMVETGEKLHFRGIVADKHSIGGLPGTRATMIVIPIIASAGFKIPKSSSRAITTPAGTADVMEVLSKVTFDKEQIYKIVEKTNACIVWGGSFKIAPADDEIIRIEEPLLFESFDKILVSIMAKKIAFGSTHVVIDVPYGKTMKVHSLADAKVIKEKFEELGKRFDMTVKVRIEKAYEPAGNGVGPLLEAIDVLKVLERKADRPEMLEGRAVNLATELLDLCLLDCSKQYATSIRSLYPSTRAWVQDILDSGHALMKFKEIIAAQKGDSTITSSDLKPSKHRGELRAEKSGVIKSVNNKNITILARILGAPKEQDTGLFLHARRHENVRKGDVLCTLYGKDRHSVSESIDSVQDFPIYEIE